MEAQITTVKENPLLDRREVKVNLTHEGEETPSREDVKNRVAAENGLDEENIQVDTIYTGFGKNNSEATLKVFQDFEYDEELEEDTIEEEIEIPQEYEEAVTGTITEAKETFQEMENTDWKAAVEAEKDNKNRTTLVEWLQSQ